MGESQRRLAILEQRIARGQEAEAELRAHWRKKLGLPDPIAFSVPFRAPPKANLHKVARRAGGKRVVVNDLTGVLAKQEESFAIRALEQLDDRQLDTLPWSGPILAGVTFVYTVTPSWPQWQKDAALRGTFRMIKTPDLENVVKFLWDSLEGEVFTNDKDIYSYDHFLKRYGPEELIEVTLERIPQATAKNWHLLPV
jgi:Holliday junction resolvase RusA-like endonuclease